MGRGVRQLRPVVAAADDAAVAFDRDALWMPELGTFTPPAGRSKEPEPEV